MNHDELAAILRKRWGDDVEVWHTGGGVMNPAVILERGSGGAMETYAVRYLLFSMGWDPAEASCAVYDERIDGGEAPLAEWIGEGDEVPMDSAGIIELATDVIMKAKETQK